LSPDDAVKAPLLVKLCLLYNKLFRFRARWDWLIGERMAAEVRRQRDPHGEDLRYAEQEFQKAVKFVRRFGRVNFRGRRVLDFGCRFGGSTLWYALQGPARVTGVDLSEESLSVAQEYLRIKLSSTLPAEQARLTSERLEFRKGEAQTIPLDDGAVNLIVSEDVIEHLEDCEAIFREWWRVLAPGGEVLLSFGPLWYHPHGVHLWEIFPGPWTHLIFPERVCVQVRNLLKKDGQNGSHWTELNKMTMTRFERLVRLSRFKQRMLRTHAVLGLKPLTFLPGLRELFISQVDCILEKP
jgi:SAM-dependent methyltransferase